VIEIFNAVIVFSATASLCPSLLAIPILIVIRLCGLRSRDPERYLLGVIFHALNIVLFVLVVFFYLRWADNCHGCTNGLLMFFHAALPALFFWSFFILAAVQNVLSFTRGSKPA